MLSILGMGCSHPSTVISNCFLEQLGIDSSAEWILAKIGIQERRTVLPLEYISGDKNRDPRRALSVASHTSLQLGGIAAAEALARAGIEASQLGLVLSNCCTPEGFIPNEAQRLSRFLGIDVPAYDVQTACPSFALHIDHLVKYQESELPDYVLCVSTAAMTTKVNYADRSDSSILSDGAAAWVVSGRKPGRLRVEASSFIADSRRWEAVSIKSFGHFQQNGRAIRDFSVRQTVHILKDLEKKYNLDWKRDVFVGHQANATMLEQIVNNRKIPKQNHWHNVEKYGNQAGAGAPAVLAQKWDCIKPGQKIVVVVVGAGLSWGALVLNAC